MHDHLKGGLEMNLVVNCFLRYDLVFEQYRSVVFEEK